jgi:aldehyde:ferredoxin oxidoreductase
MDDFANAVSALTGWKMTSKDLLTVAERAWNITRLFNTREGFTRKDDTLPERLFTQGSTEGPSKNEVVDRASFDKMLDEYYDLVGWDSATGIPNKNKLLELEIDKI